eukprot:TRINITY_DN44422_c0_g1_i1.p1 TRINITY_DN44422_c0_g1~~TRINITY_DN44422_c0_g1_i1.p1  ORF type:complete len:523 (-),score=106.52 TRINITY_DN44422_c0_g1_i1:205-1773(-)
MAALVHLQACMQIPTMTVVDNPLLTEASANAADTPSALATNQAPCTLRSQAQVEPGVATHVGGQSQKCSDGENAGVNGAFHLKQEARRCFLREAMTACCSVVSSSSSGSVPAACSDVRCNVGGMRGGPKLRAAIARFEQGLADAEKCAATSSPRKAGAGQRGFADSPSVAAAAVVAPTRKRSQHGGTPGLRGAGAPAAARPKFSAEAKGVDPFHKQLYDLLQRLDAEQRRRIICGQLSQDVRLKLEKWILRNKPSSSVMPDERAPAGRKRRCRRLIGQVSDPCGGCDGSADSKGGFIGLAGSSRLEGRGYFACVHLASGLHAQSACCASLSAAVAALRVLVEYRHGWRRGFTSPLQGQPCTYFRAQLSLMGCRFAAPLRQSAAAALRDWRLLTEARGEALITRGSLRQGYTPAAAEAQWSAVMDVWRRLQQEHGRSEEDLAAEVRSKQAKRRPVQARVGRLWEESQLRTLKKLNKLLTGAPRPSGRRRCGLTSEAAAAAAAKLSSPLSKLKRHRPMTLAAVR